MKIQMVNADDLSMYDRDGQVGNLTNCSITQCQQMIARENSWHIKEIGVVTCAKTCEDGQPPLLLGAPSHAVQNPPQAASSSQPVESLWRGVLETILSGFFPQLKDGKNNEQARMAMLMVTTMIMMSSLQRACELL